jgi:anaerobic dimethyl sulfoxide reductase subunit B (iron-sulfur subunit)
MSTTQYGFYYDAGRCIGCRACVFACKDRNDNEAGESLYWRTVTTVESGKIPNLRLSNQSLSCNHCADPACVAVCPSKALSKRAEDGIVVVDKSKCIGCKACGAACPYGVPQYGTDGKMQKCDLCLDNIREGKKTACDSACTGDALYAGPLNELAHTWAKKSPVLLAGATHPSLLIPKPK